MFLLEEDSMRVLLNGLLPRIFPDLLFQCVSHDGKDHLEKSISDKLLDWREPGVRFVIAMDNDRGDCLALKRRLRKRCAVRPEEDWLIRIVCQELEAWYLGEPDALAEAFGDESLRRIGRKARFREPDAVPHPAAAMAQLVPRFRKVPAARMLANHLSRERNRSPSFQAFLDGIENIALQPPSKQGTDQWP